MPACVMGGGGGVVCVPVCVRARVQEYVCVHVCVHTCAFTPVSKSRIIDMVPESLQRTLAKPTNLSIF